jgi:phosphoribosylaminoimidazole-succinocarboxamide synthase
LLVATDRISAFDWVLPTGIPDKGRILTALSRFWFDLLGEPNHLISTDTRDLGLPNHVDPAPFVGRSTLVRKTRVVPIECVVRGYLSGSGWKEYRQSGVVCGVPLPAGLVESDRLPGAIFTPATKAETGHDENISFDTMAGLVGEDISQELRRSSIAIYERAAEHARTKGILIADTKFEWGLINPDLAQGKSRAPAAEAKVPAGEASGLLLIDEALTPDSSRFWPEGSYRPGGPQPSFDKQFVRDWLETCGWDKNSPPPPLPDEVVEKTRQKYIEAYETLTGRRFY